MDPDSDLWSKTDSDDDEMTLAIIPLSKKHASTLTETVMRQMI